MEAGIAAEFAFFGRGRFDQLLDDVVGGDPFGFGGEVEDDAVSEDRFGHRDNVVGADVCAAVEQRSCLAAEQQILHGSRAGSPAQPFVDEVGSAGLADSRLASDGEGVFDDVIGHGDLADDPLQFNDVVIVEDRFDGIVVDAGRLLRDLFFLGEVRIADWPAC